MLTIFTCPKSFEGVFKTIQRNAIKSWLNLNCEKEIIVLGDDYGVDKICKEFNLKHIPEIEKEDNIPLISSIFEKAEKNATYDILMFINSDIMLFGDIIKPIKFCQDRFNKFIASGLRIDTDINKEIDFSNKDEIDNLTKLEINFNQEKPFAPDYFIFKRGTFTYLPPFLIGRFFWDNWIFYYAKRNKIPLIDLTYQLKAIHQNHPYSFEISQYFYEKGIENKHIKKNFKLAGFGAVFEAVDFDFTLDKNFNLVRKKIPTKKFLYYVLRYFYLKVIFNLNPRLSRYLINLRKRFVALIKN